MPDNSRRMLLFINDILKSLEKIEEYSAGLSFEELKENQMAVDAIIRNFEIIGEAVKYIPNEIKEKFKDIPWKDIIGMRDILIHQYFGEDLDLTWEVVKEEIPKLKKQINSLKANF